MAVITVINGLLAFIFSQLISIDNVLDEIFNNFSILQGEWVPNY